jgi:hypothetical protein
MIFQKIEATITSILLIANFLGNGIKNYENRKFIDVLKSKKICSIIKIKNTEWLEFKV